MEQLKTRLNSDAVRGAVQSADGEVVEFHRKGVADLFTLLTENPSFLKGGMIADRVIGRGAALLLLKGGISEVFAYVMSQSAYDLLCSAGVKTSCATLQPHIINRTGDGICPVEQLTQSTDSPDEAYILIKQFLISKNII